MAGPSSPRIIRCRRSGSTPCSSPTPATKCSRWARPNAEAAARRAAAMPVITHEDFDELATATSDPSWDYLAGLPAALTDTTGGAQQPIAAFRGALTEGDD